MRRRLTFALALAGTAIALVATGAGQAAPAARKQLVGTVGPGFTITVDRRTVTHGKFRITIRDRSSAHNFHLIGPGVNKKTSVAGTGVKVWLVTLRVGTYRFVCDPHASSMKGTIRVR